MSLCTATISPLHVLSSSFRSPSGLCSPKQAHPLNGPMVMNTMIASCFAVHVQRSRSCHKFLWPNCSVLPDLWHSCFASLTRPSTSLFITDMTAVKFIGPNHTLNTYPSAQSRQAGMVHYQADQLIIDHTISQLPCIQIPAAVCTYVTVAHSWCIFHKNSLLLHLHLFPMIKRSRRLFLWILRPWSVQPDVWKAGRKQQFLVLPIDMHIDGSVKVI